MERRANILVLIFALAGCDTILAGDLDSGTSGHDSRTVDHASIADRAADRGAVSDQLTVPDQTAAADQGTATDLTVLPQPDHGATVCVHPNVVAQCSNGWCTIPAGCFMMGSPVTEPCRQSNETLHQVTLTRDFEIQKTEVTQGEFQSLMGYNPSYFQSCGTNCPVDNVNWYEAAAYCNTLSTQSGLSQCYACSGNGASVTCSEAPTYNSQNIYDCPGYRLPTEAEWEYAYRAGTTTAYYNGANNSAACSGCTTPDSSADQIGWYSTNSGASYSGCTNKSNWTFVDISNCGCLGTHPVGQKTPNAWGLYDMAGSLFEWCHDAFHVYPGSAVTDPWGGSGFVRSLRGGAWNHYAWHIRGALRNGDPEDRGLNETGFRCARTIPTP